MDASISQYCEQSGRAYAKNRSPAGVKPTRRVERLNSSTCSSDSSDLMCFDKVDWARNSSSAASEKFLCFSTVKNDCIHSICIAESTPCSDKKTSRNRRLGQGACEQYIPDFAAKQALRKIFTVLSIPFLFQTRINRQEIGIAILLIDFHNESAENFPCPRSSREDFAFGKFIL